jgi:hypothetical protein
MKIDEQTEILLVPKRSLGHNCVPKYNLGTRGKNIMVRGAHPGLTFYSGSQAAFGNEINGVAEIY